MNIKRNDRSTFGLLRESRVYTDVKWSSSQAARRCSTRSSSVITAVSLCTVARPEEQRQHYNQVSRPAITTRMFNFK